LGKISGVNLYITLLQMFLWAFSLFVLSQVLWKIAFNKLSIQGG
jgi:ABC-type uncharacterized transport system permease subunit